MPKLLQINVTANWGSTGKIAEQIGKLAIQKGWDSYIAYGRMMNPSKSKLIKIGTSVDVYLHYLVSRILDAEGLASKRATRKLTKEIDRIKPDIVHLHNIHDHYLNYPVLFEYLANNNIPVVWTHHDQWATTGHCAFNLVGCERWKNLCHDCPERQRWALDSSKRNYLLKKKFFSAVRNMTVVSVSDWLNNQIKESFLRQHSLRVIKNGVDTDVFKPTLLDVRKRYGIGKKKIILGVASVWSKMKGLEDLVKLSRLISNEWVIVLVGHFRDRITSDRIIHIEQTQNKLELTQLYSSAHVMVSLSRSETFGLTIAEGMACGTPAIVYGNMAPVELLTDETGAVIKENDIDALLCSIERFKDKTPEVASRCRERAEKYFKQNELYDEYISLHNKMLGGKFMLLAVAYPWSERKGLKDYIALSKQLPNNVIIVLVGLNEEQKKNLPSNMIGICATQNVEELINLYSMADIVLNLSYAETFGLTTIEGFACGTPGIVYNVTASPELITEGVGKVVAAGDIDGVVTAVQQILSAEKPVDNCRKRAISYYKNTDRLEQYFDLYDAIIDRNLIKEYNEHPLSYDVPTTS